MELRVHLRIKGITRLQVRLGLLKAPQFRHGKKQMFSNLEFVFFKFLVQGLNSLLCSQVFGGDAQ